MNKTSSSGEMGTASCSAMVLDGFGVLLVMVVCCCHCLILHMYSGLRTEGALDWKLSFLGPASCFQEQACGRRKAQNICRYSHLRAFAMRTDSGVAGECQRKQRRKGPKFPHPRLVPWPQQWSPGVGSGGSGGWRDSVIRKGLTQTRKGQRSRVCGGCEVCKRAQTQF